MNEPPTHSLPIPRRVARESGLPWLTGGFPLYLAPMAGFTDAVYRQLCKEHGADVMVTEFVLADALLRGHPKAWDMLDFSPEQRPMGVQIFGSDPAVMAEAARRIVGKLAPDFLDINCGCPADRITDMNAGSSLLRDLPRLAAIVEAVGKACAPVPVTVKIRIGWDEANIVASEAARLAEEAGARVIAVHGRTKKQGYSGDANWDVINQVASERGVPVIGNGSVARAEDVRRWRDSSPVSGLMIGRAALGYPWLFQEIKHTLIHGTPPPPPPTEERWNTLLRYAKLLMEMPNGGRPMDDLSTCRPRLLKITKGMKGGRILRQEMSRVLQISDLGRLREEHLARAAQEPEGDAHVEDTTA